MYPGLALFIINSICWASDRSQNAANKPTKGTNSFEIAGSLSTWWYRQARINKPPRAFVGGGTILVANISKFSLFEGFPNQSTRAYESRVLLKYPLGPLGEVT